MDLRGFEAVEGALAAAEVDAVVTPQPAEGQDVQFVTVETDATVQPQRVLNALAVEGLVEYDGPRDDISHATPELRPLGVQPGSITFEDKNHRTW